MATKKKVSKKSPKKAATKKPAKAPERPKASKGMILLEYSSNNSGGSWWLDDKDWLALEKAGWTVDWVKDRNDSLFGSSKNGRWLGALATRASKEFARADMGIQEWEQVVKQDPWEEGCNCCGNPHNFSFIDDKGEYHYGSIKTTSSFGGWS
jgi:hypothetical protein